MAVICGYCGTELPADAMFCGECGRAVVASSAPARSMIPPPLTRPVGEPEAGPTCSQCGAAMSQDDIFCGECGFVARSIGPPATRPRDTNVVERLERVEEDDPDDPTPEPHPEPHPVAFEEDVEPTRIVARHTGRERFVLQFSTGESFTVFGSGLIGRSPRAEPGEYFDELVRILDPSRSVSKTHLEFGQENGTFWVKDRYSGNGTIVREPDSKPVRCHPERRYRLVRGSRVDVGEQFFIVS